MYTKLVALYLFQQIAAGEFLLNRISSGDQFYLFHSVTLDIEALKAELFTHEISRAYKTASIIAMETFLFAHEV